MTWFFSLTSFSSAALLVESFPTSPNRVSALAARSLYSDNDVAANRSCVSSSLVACRNSESFAESPFQLSSLLRPV